MQPDESVQQILKKVVEMYGSFDSSNDSLRRCRGLLRDLAPGYTLEMNLLMFALEIGAPEELAARRDNLDVVAPRLAHRLQETQGISEENAAWSINAWAFALGLDAAAAEAKRKQQEAAALAAEQERQRVAAEQARQAAEAKRKRQEAAALAAEQERQRVAAEPIRRDVTKRKAEKQPQQENRAELVQRLRTTMQDRHRPAQARLEAGLRLADLGVLPEGLDDFIAVTGTKFRIGRYPVTNFQFRKFVDAGGYGVKYGKRPPWWREMGWEWQQERGWTERKFWNDARFNRATQPVVAISWYEAEAYCAWLNRARSVPVGYRAQLPTQEQWMLAACNGRREAPADEVDYPWGGPFDPALANTIESGLEQTTPVDMYPAGVTQAGVFDLAGNVWEWTADRYAGCDNAWWQKGGSYWSDAKGVRTSAAGPYLVRLRGHLGFRVVIVPISCS